MGTGHLRIVEGRVTRSTNTGLLMYPASRTMGYRRSPLFRAITLWNSLNSSARLLADREAFKAKAKLTVISQFKIKHNMQ